MKNISKYIWTGFIFGVLLIFIIVENISNAQSLKHYVVAGERLDGITIGKSSADSVIATYGKDFQLIDHQKYSYEMIYKNLGLNFYYCQNDPNKEIFIIEIESPAKAVTSKGIKLGKSTFKDVFRLYGEREETEDGFEYVGISFHYEVDYVGEDSDVSVNENFNAVSENTNYAMINNDSNLIYGTNSATNTNLMLSNLSDQSANMQDYTSANMVMIDEKTFKKEEANRKKILLKKVVKRIDLFEKSELRQCDVTFPKN